MDRPIITLTTDFGVVDTYVAQMKGAILQIARDAHIVDVTHAIPPQDVQRGAIALDQIAGAFPGGTIHVCVVDPGVGSTRGLVGVEAAGQRFLLPDNGLITHVAKRFPPQRAHGLTQADYWRQPVSNTFHGRDILAPIAAHWSRGTDLARFGPELPVVKLIRLPLREPRQTAQTTTGAVEFIDSFGNLITNITADLLPNGALGAMTVEVERTRITGIFRYYAEEPAGTLMALVGSNGRLEIAVNGGSAAEELGVGAGATVRIVCPR